MGLDATISNKRPIQGDTCIVKIHTQRPVRQGTLVFNKKSYTIFIDQLSSKTSLPSDTTHHYHALLGISRYTPPGTYTAKLNVVYESGETESIAFKIFVRKADFKKSIVNFTGEKKTLASNTKQLSNEASIIGKTFKKVTRKPLFKKPFILPVADPRITSEFGAYRVYNGVPKSKHAGTDFGGPVGTPILATNAGLVILSTVFDQHGNTIMIDHGLGIISIYNHLDARLVKQGDWVNQGQQIGTLGNTGITTGPHLHWGIGIQNERVNPMDFLKTINTLL